MSNEHPTLNNLVDIPDEEIRRRLIDDFKIECGPVTPQTKRILLKKLIKLEQERNASRSSSNQFNNSAANIDGDHSFTNGSNDDINGEENEPNNDEEISEISMSTHEIRSFQRARHSPPKRYSPPPNEEEDAILAFKEVEQALKTDSVRKQSSRSPKIDFASKESIINLNEYSSEGSDDNDDTSPDVIISPNTPNTFKISGIAMPRVSSEVHTYRPSTGLSRAPIRRRTKPLFDNKSSLLNYSDSDSDLDLTPRKDKICKMLLNHRPGLGRTKNYSKPSLISKFGSFFHNIKRRFVSPVKKESNNFSTSSNYISLALLIFVVIFFFVIFSIYFYSKFTHSSRYSLDLTDYAFIEDKRKLLAPVCIKEHDDDCLKSEHDRKPALNIIREIKSFIDKRIFETHCEPSSGTSSSLPEIKDFEFKTSDFMAEIKSNLSPLYASDPRMQTSDEEKLFNYDLSNAFKLIKLNTAWNINVDPFMEKIVLSPDYNINLPIQCRLKIFWRSNFWIIVSSLAVVLMSIVFGLYHRYSKNLEIQEQEQVYDLIDKSIELLQSPDEPQSMPVLHIRDTLLSPAEKKSAKFKRIWSKVVNHIENSESRVKVEFKKIDGEEFKAWKWIAATSSSYITDGESDADCPGSGAQTQKIGGVEWQGQAFMLPNSNKPSTSQSNESIEHSFQPETNRNKNIQALTRFLKIRNIFEKEAQYIDSNWSKKIKNTILEKTSQNGPHDICHIEIDDSTNEGLVFLKCASMTGATNAFHALHGWWCEKKLVSVKFLKEERYYQRFPKARHMNTPLDITNID